MLVKSTCKEQNATVAIVWWRFSFLIINLCSYVHICLLGWNDVYTQKRKSKPACLLSVLLLANLNLPNGQPQFESHQFYRCLPFSWCQHWVCFFKMRPAESSTPFCCDQNQLVNGESDHFTPCYICFSHLFVFFYFLRKIKYSDMK